MGGVEVFRQGFLWGWLAKRSVVLGCLRYWVRVVCHVVENWDGHAGNEEGGDFSKHEGDGEALKNGIGEDDAGTDDDGEGGEEHGTEADGSGFDYGLIEREALLASQLDEIDEDDGVADNDSGTGHKADHGGCGEEGPD